MDRNALKNHINMAIDALSTEKLEEVLSYVRMLKPVENQEARATELPDQSQPLPDDLTGQYNGVNSERSVKDHKLTDQQISSIAQSLDMGMEVHYHKVTGEIVEHPPRHMIEDQEELWEDMIQKVENDQDSYLTFYKMGSREAFRVMESFAASLDDEVFKDRLFQQLSMRKPFANFRYLIDESDYRDAWFAFKDKAGMDHVRSQLEF